MLSLWQLRESLLWLSARLPDALPSADTALRSKLTGALQGLEEFLRNFESLPDLLFMKIKLEQLEKAHDEGLLKECLLALVEANRQLTQRDKELEEKTLRIDELLALLEQERKNLHNRSSAVG